MREYCRMWQYSRMEQYSSNNYCCIICYNQQIMQARFWGVRGSIPTPLTGEEVEARLQAALLRFGTDEQAPDLKDHAAIADWVSALPLALRSTAGGNTPCVEVRTRAGDLVIIDLGSGIRALGDRLMSREFGQGEGSADLLLSHFHWDHIQGWPFFKPAYVPGNRLRLHSRHDDLQARLKSQQQPPFFPANAWEEMRADLSYHQLQEESVSLADGRVRVSSIELIHPCRAFAYRIEADGKALVYASDSTYEKLDEKIAARYSTFYRDADLLIFDAHFSLAEGIEKSSWGHSSAIVGVDLCCRAGVRKLALFHHDPGADDDRLEHLLYVARTYETTVPNELCRALSPDNIFLAREGMTVEL